MLSEGLLDRCAALDRVGTGRLGPAGQWDLPLVIDGGCDVRVGRRRVGGAERQALLRWLPLTRRELGALEEGLFRDDPRDAVTLLVRPPTIWSLREALLAERLLPRGPSFEPERFLALERHARSRILPCHLSRLREAVGRIERQLPADGMPKASAIVASGCAAVGADDGVCAAMAARQLARFATSALVADASVRLQIARPTSP